MISKLRGRITSAHVIALAALFVALGGTAFAAATVGTNDIKNGAVTKPKLAGQAVATAKIKKLAVKTNRLADRAVKSGKLADRAVMTEKLADLAVTTEKLADLAVNTEKIADDAITGAKIADHAVNSQDIADAAVRTPQLGNLTRRSSGFTTSVPGNTSNFAGVSCEPGERAISGGGNWSVSGGTTVQGLQIRATYPILGATNQPIGWGVEGENRGTLTRSLNAFVVCLAP